MLYALARPFLFRLDPETAHELALCSSDLLARLPGVPGKALTGRKVRAMGLEFPNPVGLAAGLDKNGAHIDGLAALGFGFIEVGTVTPRPQPGNPKPRLFRLPEARAIINRMGFNNEGVERLVENVRRARYDGILGINIGKNFDTPVERAADDYVACLEKVYEVASYVTINISSPNTKNLRQLQQADELSALLERITRTRESLAQRFKKRVPLAVKIAPDLDDEGLEAIAEALRRYGIDAVIATNTTLSREEVKGLPHAEETGGLSGAPLTARSTAIVRKLHALLGDEIPIIGVGGIMSGADAAEKLAAGATLVQLYSGLIYRGPELVTEAVEATR
ncbi:MAG: quinone-dependent dihydroorotate dehydrogenase [Pseudomonadota bacterium]|nr:MAG: quinone-dependent dihydroorotate dehydrogenase [Pseudomonadota bacterium]